MRVLDIISQGLLEGEIDTPIKFIWKFFLQSGGRAVAKEAVLASELVAKAAVKKGGLLTVEEMERLGVKSDLLKNPTWIRQSQEHSRLEISKKAPKIKPVEKPIEKPAKPPATVKGAMNKLSLATNRFTGLVSKLTAVGISVAPFYTYNEDVNVLKEQLDAGEISQAEFEAQRQARMSIAVATFAASLTGFFAIKSVGRGSSWLLGWIPGFKPAMSLLTSAGAIALEEWLRGPDGTKLIAKAFAEDMFELDRIFGAPVIKALDELKKMFPILDNGISSPGTMTPAERDKSVAANKDKISATSSVKPDEKLAPIDAKTQAMLNAFGYKQTQGINGAFNYDSK
jgi:hypothetical protein